tara:strand:- start:14398 stop:15213 length:816 start_codon:yes stop_codon:yes gene_type:complete
MTLYKSKYEAVMAMISYHMNNNDDTITQISEASGIGRQQIHRWLNGSAKSIHNKSLESVAAALNYNVERTSKGIVINHHIQHESEEDHTMIEAIEDKQRIITLQDEKIKALEKEYKRLKEENMILSLNDKYESTIPHFTTVVKIKNVLSFKALRQTIEHWDNTAILAKKLGMSDDHLRNEYIKIGQEHNIKEHPIRKLISNKTNQELDEFGQTIPQTLKTHKFTLSAFYYKFHVLYQKEDKFAHTECVCKVDWSMSPTITTKNTIYNNIAS